MSAVEQEFIVDAVVGFLSSPIWNTPVRSFIEQNSLVFDPESENHEEYQKIHSNYKKMVESLLSSFLKDVGISEEQFMMACKGGSGSPQFSGLNRDVFEHMWAAEDYEVFKRLMIQKNVELQLQALQIIQQIHKVQIMPMPMPMPGPVAAPPSEAPPTGVPPTPAVDEEAIMQEVLRRSKEEYESQKKDANGKTEQELEKTIAESKEESERQSLSLPTLDRVVAEETTRLMEIAQKEQEELEKALQMSLGAQKQQTAAAEKLRDEVKQSTVKPSPKPPVVEGKQAAKTSPVESKPAPKPSPVKTKSPTQDTKPSEKSKTTALPPLSGQPKKATGTPSDAAAGWMQSAKDDAAAASSSAKPAQTKEITPEEVKRRAEYLKQQRDKLLALKRQEREKNLTKYTEQQPKARLTSARAARRVTAGEQVDSPAPKSSEDEAKKLAMRRALADCLKREVVDKD